MDEGLFIFMLFCGLVLYDPLSPSLTSRLTYSSSFAAIVYCFLSTCLGIELRRSDIWEAVTFPSVEAIRERDRRRRVRAGGGNQEFELDDIGHRGMGMGMGMGYDRVGPGMGMEEIEMMRRSGGRGGYY
jgi:hypothetical protein